jgi:hypothetical protein
VSEQLEQRLQELREQADRYAKAHSQRIYLDHYRKSKLAMLMKYYAAKGFDTVNAQEREARTHPEYLEVLDGLRDATEVAEKEGWHLRIAMQGSSLWQTQEATKRAEMQAYKGSD